MIDLFPTKVMEFLRDTFGERFKTLGHMERVALALAASEDTVNHARLREVSTEHPLELSKALQHLTQLGMLESTGGRGAVYHLPGEPIPTPDEVFGGAGPFSATSSPNLAPSSPNLGEQRDKDGCLISEQLRLPILDDLDKISPSLRAELERIASEPRRKGKVSRDVLIKAIMEICSARFVTLRSISKLVDRKPDTLREQYLARLVRDKRLRLAFPKTPTHEKQAYTTSESQCEDS